MQVKSSYSSVCSISNWTSSSFCLSFHCWSNYFSSFGIWKIVILFSFEFFHFQKAQIEQSIEENHSDPDNSSTVNPTENQAPETVESDQTNQSTDEKSAVVQDFVTTYFNTKDEPFLKNRVSLLNEKKLITDEYNQEMTQSIGDMDN